MTQHRVGDAEIILNGERKTLRLTLGALAALEETLGEGDFASLGRRLETPRVSDLLLILQALLQGGGALVSIDALKASDLDLSEAARAIAKAFASLHPEERIADARHEGRRERSAVLRDAGLRPAPQDEGGAR